MSVCPSVHPSVRHKAVLYQWAKRRITQTTLYNSPENAFFWRLFEIPMKSPQTRAPNVSKNCVFNRLKNSAAQTPYRRKFVSLCHDRLLQ